MVLGCQAIPNGLQKASDAISKGLEDYFYRHGKWVASHPKLTILGALVGVALCGLGLFRFNEEKNMVKLWIPPNSDFAHNNQWLWENFPPDLSSVILEHEENILVPEVIQQMYQIHKNVLQLRTSGGQGWLDLCYKLPVVDVESSDLPSKPVQKREAPSPNTEEDFFGDFGDESDDFAAIKSGAGVGKAFDPSVVFYPEQYCPIVEAMPMACFEMSILEMFAQGGQFTPKVEATIHNLDQEELITAVNTIGQSGIFLRERDFSKYLGGIQRNSTGHIVGAKATFIRWFGRANISEIQNEKGRNGMDQQPVDVTTLEFEQLLQISLDDKCGYPEGLKSQANVQRSYGDISNGAIWDDVIFLTCGYFMIYVYVQSMLGRFNRVEQRAFLGAMGITSSGLAILVSMGLCSLMGLDYGPMHSLIPCLLLGLGVDDMFVIVQSFNNSEGEDKAKGIIKDLPERIGQALKHAGVGITITSVTDIVVFAVGGTTTIDECRLQVLPSLRSYSLYTATGIAATYVLQVTFFVAWLAIDQKRIDDKRDGACCWVVHGDQWKPNKLSQRSLMEEAFDALGRFLAYPIVKISVLLTTLAFFALGCWGTTLLEVEFRYVEFLPDDSSIYQWFQLHTGYFPGDGEMGTLYFSEMDLYKELPKIKNLVDKFTNETDIIFSFDSWYPEFESYLNDYFLQPDEAIPDHPISEEFFNEKLTQFLFSPIGAQHMNKFQFAEPIACGTDAPKVLVSTVVDVEFPICLSKLFSPAYDLPWLNIWVNATLQIAKLLDVRRPQSLVKEGTCTLSVALGEHWRINHVHDRVIHKMTGKTCLLTFSCVDPYTTLYPPMSTMEFVHRKFNSSTQHIPAMNWVKDSVVDAGFPGITFAMAQSYSRWEIDEVISQELFRNLFLAIICVSITTMLLIANTTSCIIVILCVVMSLVDVGGAMYFWGLTIDIVASTNIIISVGLCVDFSAHVAHYFMLQSGSKNERMRSTLRKIGPAVFNGGISTLIAVLMLMNSKSHVFISYFKVFFLMIVFGLFHGLLFLPVVLSLLGSKPYKIADTSNEKPPSYVIAHDAKMEINHNEEQDLVDIQKLLPGEIIEDDGFVFYFNAPELERGREEIKRLEVNAGRRKNGEELTAVKSTTADELSKETTKPTGKEVEAKRRVVLKGPPLLKYEDIPEVPFESHELPLFEDLGLGPRDGGESDERGYFRGAKFIPFDTLPTVQKDHGFVPMVRRIHSNTTTPDAYQCKECLVVGELAFDNLNGTFDKITSRDFFFAVDGYMNDFVDTVISHPEDYVQLGDLHQVGSTIYLNFTFTYGHVYTSAREERLQKVFNEYTTNSTALAQADLHILPEQSMLMVERNESLRWDPTNEIRPDPFGLMESGVENFHVHWIVDMIFLLLGFTSPIFVITGFKHQRQKLRFKRYALKEAKRMEIYHQQRQRFNRSVINQRIGLYGHLKTRLEPAKWVRVDIGAKRLVVGGQAVISGSGLDRKPIEFPNSIRDTETELMAEKVKKMELAPQCPSLKKVDHQDIPRLRRLRDIRNNQVMPQRKDSAQRDQSTLDLTKNDQNKTKKADQCNQTILAEQSKAKRDASEVKKANRCEQTILSDPSTSTKDQVEVKKADPPVVTKDRAETEVAHRSDTTVCAATKTPKGSNKADQL
eukprot:maker-scaffold11_size778918-snap-gene-1.12 protein:Tk03657 transcript:maker-scaffold11_size778918-snap-gene-1.12-mRNA-1 annotation:"hypothetical protein DAPPUDRAFT_306990"